MAVILPAGDNSAGLAEYTDAVIEALGGRSELILVAQSLGGFTAPLVCERLPVDLLVLLNAMVPTPGQRASDWWANTSHGAARAEQAACEGRRLEDDPDLLDAFFHDVPPEVTAEAMANGTPVQSPTPFTQPWPVKAWPAVPTSFLQSRDDRFFPVEFQRLIVQDRLGSTLDEMPGGHLVALSQPRGSRAGLRPIGPKSRGRATRPLGRQASTQVTHQRGHPDAANPAGSEGERLAPRVL